MINERETRSSKNPPFRSTIGWPGRETRPGRRGTIRRKANLYVARFDACRLRYHGSTSRLVPVGEHSVLVVGKGYCAEDGVSLKW